MVQTQLYRFRLGATEQQSIDTPDPGADVYLRDIGPGIFLPASALDLVAGLVIAAVGAAVYPLAGVVINRDKLTIFVRQAVADLQLRAALMPVLGVRGPTRCLHKCTLAWPIFVVGVELNLDEVA